MFERAQRERPLDLSAAKIADEGDMLEGGSDDEKSKAIDPLSSSNHVNTDGTEMSKTQVLRLKA